MSLNKKSKDKNIFNKTLKKCSINPMTGYQRDGYCKTNIMDRGSHLVCAKMDQSFLDFTKSKGNDLSSVVRKNDNWCLCQDRWLEAYKQNKAPRVIKNATNKKIRHDIKKRIQRQNGGKTKKQFLYYPNNPKKSFDVYIDKDPSDTIPIKYKTVQDVKDTIKKLESLYKHGKYTHKRIWQVGMIMKVRLQAMDKHKKSKYSNAKYVKQRYDLANKYFKFLGKRTKQDETKRKKMRFMI